MNPTGDPTSYHGDQWILYVLNVTSGPLNVIDSIMSKRPHASTHCFRFYTWCPLATCRLWIVFVGECHPYWRNGSHVLLVQKKRNSIWKIQLLKFKDAPNTWTKWRQSGRATLHDDVIKWKHFPRHWPLWGEFTGDRWIPLTKASDAELWCFLWSACAWINGWANHRDAGDLRRHRAYYDVTVMMRKLGQHHSLLMPWISANMVLTTQDNQALVFSEEIFQLIAFFQYLCANEA